VQNTGLLETLLIIGGNGQLGTELRETFADCKVIAPPREDLDLTEQDSILTALRRHRPSLVVNVAAYHHVERCESFPDRAFAVNALAVDRLAGACALVGAAFATFSTDYREGDAPNPLSAYGASKLAGEHLTRRHGARHFIIRTSGLYGRKPSPVKGYTFVDRILEQANLQQRIRVVDDIVFSPSFAPNVAQGFRRVVDHGAFGTYHITDQGETSWFAFASEALRLAGLQADIEPVTSAAFPSAVRRPAYSPLAHAALESAGIAPMPRWQQGLHAYIASREGVTS
jgi:dTDP-4-dehydrorhamnose reductase